MKFHLIKRSIAQEVADELDNTIRQRREALEHVEYWGAAHAMLTDREQRLRNELAEHAGTQTLPVRVEYAVGKPPLDTQTRTLLIVLGCMTVLLIGTLAIAYYVGKP